MTPPTARPTRWCAACSRSSCRDGAARFEQTDYGHPGRFNPWEPRGIDGALQPRTPELLALCTAVSSLLR